MSVEWVSMLESIVFSRIKNDFSASIKKKYKMSNENFTTDGSVDTPAVFPFVRFKVLPSVENGRDLEGTSINSIIYSVQIEVFDNKSKQNAKTVSFEVLRIMKSLGFNAISIPYEDKYGEINRYVSRYRRTIDSNDVL